jgi:N-acyl-phosphatidylethanolamine-hydrolysing phospholipase D
MRRFLALSAVGAALVVGFTGCGFARIALHNVPWFFRTPAPAPRSDLPRTDDAALSVLWVGHATALVQLDDLYLLTDPVFTERVGGLSRRLVAVGLTPQQLPRLSAVLVSHRHFDHLSTDSFPLIAQRVETVLVPPGAGPDIPEGPYATRELGAWESFTHEGLTITAVPVVHEGSRLLHDASAHPLAFTGYVAQYHGLTVYFSGDTAYRAEVFTEVAQRFPSIDLALLPIGPIAPEEMMRSHHLDPEQALQAFEDLGAQQMVAIHFGTYLHSLDAPGDCERRLDDAVARRPDLAGRVHRLEAGERRPLRERTTLAAPSAPME